MSVRVLSLIERDGFVCVRARASADQAEIYVRIRFPCPNAATKRELWQRARDEVLRYLDVA